MTGRFLTRNECRSRRGRRAGWMPKRVCESNVAERQRQADEEKAKNDANFEAMRQMQERARAKRVEMYGEESEIEFEPKLKAFRDDMMSRIEDGGADLNEKMQIESGDLLEEVVERVPHKLTITEIEDDEEVAEESEVPALEKVISEPVEVMDDIIEPEDQEAAFEQDPMKIYKRPIAQHLVEKEIIEEIVYKSEDAEITLPLLDESASLKMDFKLDYGVPALEIEEVKLEQSIVAFAEFKPTQPWNEAVAEVTETKQTVEHEESKQTLIEDGDESVEEQGVRVVWTKPAKSVTVTGTFDNWSQSQVCKETGSGFETFVPLTGSRKLVFKFVVDGVWTVSDEYETATDEHVFNVDVRETLIT